MALRRGLIRLAETLKQGAKTTSVMDTSSFAAPSSLYIPYPPLGSLMALPSLNVSHHQIKINMNTYNNTRLLHHNSIEQQQQQHTSTSSSIETLEQVRSRIFGTHIGNGLRSGRKVLRKKLIGNVIASYYPEPIEKSDPFMIDLKAERAKFKLDKLRRRGKGPPKKGAGKRAGKK